MIDHSDLIQFKRTVMLLLVFVISYIQMDICDTSRCHMDVEMNKI